MKRKHILFHLLLVTVLVTCGCYNQPSPLHITHADSTVLLNTIRPSVPLYAQNVRVTVGGMVHRVNNATVYKNLSDIPFADGYEQFVPDELSGEDIYYLLVNQTFFNPFDITYEFFLGFNSIGEFVNGVFSDYPNRLLAYDDTQYPSKIKGLGHCTIAEYEEISIDLVYYITSDELFNNVYLGLRNYFDKQDSLAYEVFIPLFIGNKEGYPATLLIEDMPQPDRLPSIETNTSAPTTDKAFMPGQFVDVADAIEINEISYRLNTVEIVSDYREFEWFPADVFMNVARDTAEFRREPGYIPDIFLVSMSVGNMSVDSIKDISLTTTLFSIDETNNIIEGAAVYGLKGTDAYNPTRLFFSIEPYETLDLTMLFVYAPLYPDHDLENIPRDFILLPVNDGSIPLDKATFFRVQIEY